MKPERKESAAANFLTGSQAIASTAAKYIVPSLIVAKNLTFGLLRFVLPLFVFLFAQASINAQAPDGFTLCASEGGRCQVSDTREVKYGANGKFVSKITGVGIDCNNSVFGDPAPNVRKQCYVSNVPSPRQFPKTNSGLPGGPLIPLYTNTGPAIAIAATCKVFNYGMHVTTFDTRGFDNFSAGVFSLVESDALTVQVTGRIGVNGSKSFSFVKAVAVRFGSTVYTFDEQGPSVKSNTSAGVTLTLNDNSPGEMVIFHMQDGSLVTVTKSVMSSIGPAYNVNVAVPSGAKNKVRGICGNFDGNVENDLLAPDGRAIFLLPPKNYLPDGTNLTMTWTVPDNRNLFVCGANCAGYSSVR